MSLWTDQLTAQPGNFAPILQVITKSDGECLQEICDTLKSHAEAASSELLDYVVSGVCVNMKEQIYGQSSLINLASIATLKAVGVIMTTDNMHVGVTPLGLGFMESVSQ